MKELTITNLEGLNIMYWANQLTEEKNNALPMKVRYYMKKALSKIARDAKDFEAFRDEFVQKLQKEYFTDEKSYEEEVDGQTVRKIKDEFMEEYQKEVADLNDKLNELLAEKNTYEFMGYDIDKMVEELPDDTPLTFEDINMIDALLGEA